MDRASLSEALDSIATQSWPHLEIVVINAKGSAHRPLPSVWGDRCLRVISTGERLSRSRAANVGLTEANGEYLGFLDDDDLLLPQHINSLIERLENQRVAKVAYAGVRVDVYEDGSDAIVRSFPFNDPYSRPKLFGRNFIPIHSAIFSAELIRSSGCKFDESLEILEDWDFWIQLAMLTDFVHCDQITAIYRNRGSSGLGKGLRACDEGLRFSTGAVFEKWRKSWSGNDIADIVLYRDDMCEAAGRYVEDFEREYKAQLRDQRYLLEIKQREIEQLKGDLELAIGRSVEMGLHAGGTQAGLLHAGSKRALSITALLKKLLLKPTDSP